MRAGGGQAYGRAAHGGLVWVDLAPMVCASAMHGMSLRWVVWVDGRDVGERDVMHVCMCCAGPCLDVFFPILKAPAPLVVRRRRVLVLVLYGVALLLMILKQP